MKKNYFSTLFAALMLFLAMPATAQVSGITEVFGKYQFTATMEVTDYGKQFEDLFSNNCEVTITASDIAYYSVMVQGFAGAAGTIYPSGFDTNKQALNVLNPNNGQWGNSLAMSFPEGGYPYGAESYSGILWSYDAVTKTFTVPDFSIVGNIDNQAGTAEVVAKFTNVKMVMTEAEVVEIPSIAGDYNYEPVEGYIKNDSTFAYTFNMLIEATDDTNKAYDVTITYGDFAPFTLSGTFDGEMLTIPYDSIYLIDGEHKYFFGASSPATEKTGAFTFQYQSETSLMQWDRIYIREDSVYTETKEWDEELQDSVVVGRYTYPIVQRLNWGYATCESEAVKGFSWAGTFDVTATKIVANEELAASFGEWPTEFKLVIEEKSPGSFYVTEFLGHDIYMANQSNCVIKPADDNKSATFSLSQAWGMLLLESLGGGEYLQIFDEKGSTTSLTLTLNDDGTLSIGSFFIQKTTYDASYDPKPVIFYQDVTARKHIEIFNWFDTFTLSADVEVVDGGSYPETFDVRFGDAEVYGATFNSMVAEFFGYNTITSLNQGANAITVSEDTQSATIPTGILAGGAYPNYFKLYDINGSTTDLNLVVNEDGTISMDDFFIYTHFNDYGESPIKETAAAKFTNVVLTRKPEPTITLTAEVVEGTERTFEFASAVAGTKVSIDWGDGNVVEAATLEEFDGWNQSEVKGTPVGNGEIKIYVDGDLCYFHCVSNVNGPGITKLDVSKATELTKLYANGNKLTSVDVSMLTKLETLYLNNNSLTEVKDLPASLTTELNLQNNKLESLDVSNLTSLIKLTVSDNNLGTLDVSDMTALNQLYAMNCGLTSFTAGAVTTPKARINVNNNQLETLDLSEATGLEGGQLFAMGNNLTEIKFPDVEISSANITKNKFTLATIPATAKVKTLTYAPQQDMVIEDIKGTIDLSAQNNLVGLATEAKATVYTWYTEDGTALVAGTDYTEEAGKFTFIKDQTQKVYCTMTTEAFPKFTSANIFKTVAVTAVTTETGIDGVEADVELTGDIYTVDGKLIKRNASVVEMPKGLYIVKTAAGKAVKVIRK